MPAIVANFNRKFIETGDLEVFQQIVSADFVKRTPHPGGSDDRDGAAYLFTQVLRPAFPDLEFTFHDQVTEGDKVVTRKPYRVEP